MSNCTCVEQTSEADLLARLDEAIAERRQLPGALIPVLQIAQGLFGYLPETVLKRICHGLGKSYSEVAGVVGFYSFFSTTPRGRHTIRVCLGTACYVRGGKQVLEAMRKELGIEVGETSKDGMFSLEVARCFGACGLAPAMCIDEEVYKRVRPTKLREILATYYAPVKAGAKKVATKKPVAGTRTALKRVGVHASKKGGAQAAHKKGVKVHG